MKKYICVRGWQRNPTGEIIEEWQYNKLPDEVKTRNFKEHVAIEKVVETPPVTKPPIEEVKPAPITRFKPFTLEDALKEE